MRQGSATRWRRLLESFPHHPQALPHGDERERGQQVDRGLRRWSAVRAQDQDALEPRQMPRAVDSPPPRPVPARSWSGSPVQRQHGPRRRRVCRADEYAASPAKVTPSRAVRRGVGTPPKGEARRRSMTRQFPVEPSSSAPAGNHPPVSSHRRDEQCGHTTHRRPATSRDPAHAPCGEPSTTIRARCATARRSRSVRVHGAIAGVDRGWSRGHATQNTPSRPA